MEACEAYEIALEKRRCRALPAEEEGPLDAHLSACASCRAYDSRARSIAAALRVEEGAVDWKALRRKTSRWRNLSFAGAFLYVAVLLGVTLSGWLDRLAHSSSAYPSLLNLPLDVLAGAVLGYFILSREWAHAKEARHAATREYLTHLYHADLVGRIRWARRSWIWLFILGWIALRPGHSWFGMLSAVVLIAVTLREWFVMLPRLEREEEEFPFFDDLPHIV